MNEGKVTLYVRAMFGVTKIEATKVTIEIKPYAQYPEAVWVRFLPKGKRKLRETVQSYKPSLVVLEGWGHPDFTEMFHKVDGGFMTRYASCDPRWETEFDEQLAQYLAKMQNVQVLADYRTERQAA